MVACTRRRVSQWLALSTLSCAAGGAGAPGPTRAKSSPGSPRAARAPGLGRPVIDPASSAPAPSASPAPAASALERRFPQAGNALPRLPFGTLPTPLERARALGRERDIELWIKRDDRAADPLGGSKVRKLELLLAQAKREGARGVVTFGGVGSIHALATAVYGRSVGLEVTLVLAAERPTARTRAVLLTLSGLGARILAGSGRLSVDLASAWRAGVRKEETFAIAPGGSSPLGNVGYANAGLELSEQFALAEVPAFDRIVIAGGTLGSAAGLVLGLGLSGATMPVTVVRAASLATASRAALVRQVRQTAAVLEGAGVALPSLDAVLRSVRLEHGFVGGGYAQPTTAARRAVARAADEEGWSLETTYTGKALAAALEVAPGERVLFWNTYDPRLPAAVPDPNAVPAALRGYLDLRFAPARGAHSAPPRGGR